MKLILALLTITYFVAANASTHYEKLHEIFLSAQKPTASQLIGNWKLSVKSYFISETGLIYDKFYPDLKNDNTPHLSFNPSGILDFFSNEEGIVVTAVGVYHYDPSEVLAVTLIDNDALMQFQNGGYVVKNLCRAIDDNRLICRSVWKKPGKAEIIEYAAFVRN